MDTDFSLVKATFDDIDDIAFQIDSMAFETIHKHLDVEALKLTVAGLLNKPDLGEYYVVKKNGENISSFFITWGHTQETITPDWWFQSVFVQPNYRRQGVFTRIFKQIKQWALERNALVKLYVETDNERAIKTYESLGLKRYQGVIFEDDLFWDPFKGELLLSEDLRSQVATVEDLTKIQEFIAVSQDLLSVSQYSAERYAQTLAKTIKEGHTILTYRGTELVMLTHYFTEFSDWRNALSLWVYSVRVRDTSQTSQLTHHLIGYMKQIKTSLPVGCVRYYGDQTSDGIFKSTFEALNMQEAHFFVYEMEKQ